ncbi:hypothetical protein SUGI_1103000 [Cryptomeria japonica]|nr:hypothetical protein SUGI_1103000 [Cryptomeria japonica]
MLEKLNEDKEDDSFKDCDLSNEYKWAKWVVLSVLKHASCPESLFFHFLVSHQNLQLQRVVQSFFPDINFEIYVFHENLVKGLFSSSVREALLKSFNYVRIYLADILSPCVERVISLDSDLIAIDGIEKLWGIELGEHPIGAPEYCHANLTSYFTDAFWSNGSLAKTFFKISDSFTMLKNSIIWRKKFVAESILAKDFSNAVEFPESASIIEAIVAAIVTIHNCSELKQRLKQRLKRDSKRVKSIKAWVYVATGLNVALGCGNDNESLFVGAVELLGLGHGRLSFPSQTASHFANKFSYCFCGLDKNW